MNMPKILIISGLILLITGIFLYIFEDKLNWIGTLPFDFKYENKHTKIYAPFGSMIIVSIILSFLFNFFSKLFK